MSGRTPTMSDGATGVFLCMSIIIIPLMFGFWFGYNWRGRVIRLGKDAWLPGIIRMIRDRRRVYRG